MIRAALIFLTLAPLAHAAAPVGFVDGISAAGAGGWACVSGRPALTAQVAAFAGQNLLGVYPAANWRPSVAGVCGSERAGFSFAFDRAARAQFGAGPALSVFALAPGNVPVPLPSSNAGVSLPDHLPLSGFASLGMSQSITGTVQAASPPRITLYAGAPAEDGGLPFGPTQVTVIPGGFAFSLPPPGVQVPAGATLPLFGTATDALGAPAPFLAPTLAMAGVQTMPISAHVAQAVGQSGIRNTLFTTWVPGGRGFAALAGQVVLRGNAAGFSEALVLLGTTTDDAATCKARDHQSAAMVPELARPWAAILKNTGSGEVSVPVGVALPYPVALPGSGACVMLAVSAGYAYLAGPTPQLTTLDAQLSLGMVPATAVPAVMPVGIGGEFRFTTGSNSPLAVYVGLRAERPLTVTAIAGAFSAAPVVGAPLSSGWLPVPPGTWSVGTNFYVLDAASCAAAHLQAQPGNGVFSIVRFGTPEPLPPPVGARLVMRLGADSFGGLAVQRALYEVLSSPLAGTALRLAPGDCLVGWEATVPELGGAPGMLDVEDQSTVYLRLD